jgi:FdhD protein
LKGLCHYQVLSVSSSGLAAKNDGVAEEEPLQIWLKQPKGAGDSETRLLITTMRTPGDDINLVRGWLFSSGLLTDLDDILTISHSGAAYLKGLTSNTIVISLKQSINLDMQQHARLEYVNSSCGVCGQQSIEHLLQMLPSRSAMTPFSLSQQVICALPEKLKQAQSLFSLTGGNHAVALCDHQGAILDVREDVGRHNAMDKLIGAQHETMLSGQFAVLLSGRVSFDLVQKAAMAHVPLIIAIGAPSSLAIDLCRECDIGLVGFVKEKGFNIYHGQMTGRGYTTSADLGS